MAIFNCYVSSPEGKPENVCRMKGRCWVPFVLVAHPTRWWMSVEGIWEQRLLWWGSVDDPRMLSDVNWVCFSLHRMSFRYLPVRSCRSTSIRLWDSCPRKHIERLGKFGVVATGRKITIWIYLTILTTIFIDSFLVATQDLFSVLTAAQQKKLERIVSQPGPKHAWWIAWTHCHRNIPSGSLWYFIWPFSWMIYLSKWWFSLIFHHYIFNPFNPHWAQQALVHTAFQNDRRKLFWSQSLLRDGRLLKSAEDWFENKIVSVVSWIRAEMLSV